MEDTKKDILFSLRELTRELIRKWKYLAKSELTRKEIIDFRDGMLNPLLEKLVIVAGNAIQLRKNNEFRDLISLIGEIYKSAGNVREFIAQGQEEKEHLSWTLTSKMAMEYLFVMGALSVFEDNTDALYEILNFKVKYPEKMDYIAGKMTLLISHPFYDSRSGEGDLRSFFDDAQKTTQSNKIFAEWFDNEEEKILNSFIRFDFLRGLYLFIVPEEYRRWYDNFKRFYPFRIFPIIRTLLTNEDYLKLFGEDIKPKLINFLEHVDKTHNFTIDGFSWDVGDWKSLKELQNNTT